MHLCHWDIKLHQCCIYRTLLIKFLQYQIIQTSSSLSLKMVFFKSFSFIKFVLILFRVLPKHYNKQKGLQISSASDVYVESFPQFKHRCSESSETTLIFNVEGTLLRSSSLFPYFMLVAFEAGSIIRALLLLLLYPFLRLISEEMSLKVMVLVCFMGIKKESFRIGSSVLPKFFMEDVSAESFAALRMAKKKIGVTELPQVMVESFLRDYMEVDVVVGRELKEIGGYYVGLYEEKETSKRAQCAEAKLFRDVAELSSTVIGLDNISCSTQNQLFSGCKEIYMVSEAEKLNWSILPRDRYPKPLIFHDGRLAFRPTPLSILAMFMWFPFGLVLSIFRITIAVILPLNVSLPVLFFSGIKLRLLNSDSLNNADHDIIGPKGTLFVCNHRTLLDPLFLSFGLKKPVAAVTYSLSRLSEMISPIRTGRLTRDHDQDSKMMKELLNHGDLVVCPEGTTCREPYLLRLSPLFTELSDNIVPVGMDSHVTMFHGTTAGGSKCLDPFFFMMNPDPSYTVRFLNRVRGASLCKQGDRSRYEVANVVQSELGKALGFECTMHTRKDKYLSLAGNEGLVSA
ncbi:probable glycerol-3-phosphate acyltransferase 3 [Daucus carota subsp. sativus]|nr:PREDICTED: probable glycerol-3-phosphate acyltransferase 3 isoform X3 [Daucus carota subsp. sativus]XP_017229413.1 PREDICTED: probable glycerol-3-phosphate acyltransferase 3 isoform X3 [Daucus carota subsp. sativus]XP_017229414.1 PREDICTED: probable glycerol-3-phosphate acyltransferase 3 isoform X3 [Daucus carota subsp. sativus]